MRGVITIKDGNITALCDNGRWSWSSAIQTQWRIRRPNVCTRNGRCSAATARTRSEL